MSAFTPHHSAMTLPGTRSLSLKKLTWIDVQDPTLHLLEQLKKKHGFHDLDVEDCLSETQRSKVDEYDDYLFIILHFPYYDARKQRFVSEEVDIFIKNDLLITVHWGVLKPLLKQFEDASGNKEEKERLMDRGTGFLLYEILDQLYSASFPLLDLMEKRVANLEKEVFAFSSQHDMLRDILNTKKNLIIFRRIIAPQRLVIPQIEHKNKKFLPESLDIYFDDVVDKVEKVWASLENLKELVDSLQETNESIISHTTNNVIKLLTVFSVIMLPLTFLTGLYGMNVNLPLGAHPMTFFFILSAMLGVVMSMLAFFKYKRWI
jgi:magnesium transporter